MLYSLYLSPKLEKELYFYSRSAAYLSSYICLVMLEVLLIMVWIGIDYLPIYFWLEMELFWY